MKKKQIFSLIVVAAILGALVYLQFRSWQSFDWAKFRQYTGGVSLWHIGAGVALIYLAYVLRAIRWAIFLKPTAPTSFRRLIAPQVIGFAALGLFGRAGEFAEDETGESDGPMDDEQNEEGEEEEEQAPQDYPAAKPPQKKKGFSAAFDTAPSKKALSLAADGRRMKLQQLAIQGYITPVVAKELTQEYCSVGALSLALSLDSDTLDDFDKVCNVLQRNGKVVRFGEVSGAQTELSFMSAADGKLYELSQAELQDEKKNPLLANAVSRSKR